ncbi:hypothetical protein [Aquabacterium sp.]|uniref:hypothetical protein n=1 Tax=Aquabacterium sp. TaxID=1872578 RepID=UPI004037C96F
MDDVRVDVKQMHYVIAASGGYTCLGFKNAQAHTQQIADALDQPNLAFAQGDFGTLLGYEKYRQAIAAWGSSKLHAKTYFDPGTDARVKVVLEQCRRNRDKIRLILGDTETGATWLDEHAVVGTIGRSTGQQKVPLLIEDGDDAGGAILSACILAIIDWGSGDFLYRHPAFQEPDLTLSRCELASHPWEVNHQGKAVARFDHLGKAAAYVAFMCGETIEPRVFTA